MCRVIFWPARLCCRLRHAGGAECLRVRCAGKWIDRRRAESGKQNGAPRRGLAKAAGGALLSWIAPLKLAVKNSSSSCRGGFFVFTAYFYGHGFRAFWPPEPSRSGCSSRPHSCAASDDDGTGRFGQPLCHHTGGRQAHQVNGQGICKTHQLQRALFPAAQNCAGAQANVLITLLLYIKGSVMTKGFCVFAVARRFIPPREAVPCVSPVTGMLGIRPHARGGCRVSGRGWRRCAAAQAFPGGRAGQAHTVQPERKDDGGQHRYLL